MRPLVGDRRDDRDMIVAPARDRNARGLAGRRIATLGADQQRRGEQPAVLERDPHAGCVAHDLGRPRRHQQRRCCSAASAASRRARAEQPVLEHDAERVVVRRSGSNRMPPGVEPVADPDRADRAALALQPLGDADRLQHPPGRARDRGGAAVISRRDLRLRIGRIDDDAWRGRGGRARCASVRPTRPPPRMMTSARSISACPSVAAAQRQALDRGVRGGRIEGMKRGTFGAHGDGGSNGAEATGRAGSRSGARASRRLARRSGASSAALALSLGALFAAASPWSPIIRAIPR